MVGRTGAPNRDARTRCRGAPRRRRGAPRALRLRWAACSPITRRPGRFLLLAAVILGLVACAGEPAPSFDPAGPCTTDGAVPGAYPDLEARVPSSYRDAAPEAVDSGRNCSPEALGLLAERGYEEVRFAGARWSFGAERLVVLAVFSAAGLDAADVADFYADSARAEPRVGDSR